MFVKFNKKMKFFSKILIFLVVLSFFTLSYHFTFAEEFCSEYFCENCLDKSDCKNTGCFWVDEENLCYGVEKNAIYYPYEPERNFLILKSYTYGEITICLLLGLIWLTLLFDVLRKTFSKHKSFVEIISKGDRQYQ